MDGQDIQIEQIQLNTKVAMPLVNEKKIVLLPNSPLYISDLWLGLYFRGLESLTKKRLKQTETKAMQGKKKPPICNT
jgi:hypothetical protein